MYQIQKKSAKLLFKMIKFQIRSLISTVFAKAQKKDKYIFLMFCQKTGRYSSNFFAFVIPAPYLKCLAQHPSWILIDTLYDEDFTHGFDTQNYPKLQASLGTQPIPVDFFGSGWVIPTITRLNFLSLGTMGTRLKF